MFSLLATASFLFSSQNAFAQGPYLEGADAAAGKTLFSNQCASCHNRNMKDKMTGPALGGVEGRWSDYDRSELYTWIRGSQAMIQAGHPRAKELWAEWKPNVMTNFPQLTDVEIESMLLYINNQYIGTSVGPNGPESPVDPVAESSNTWLYVGLLGILVLLSFVLARVLGNLKHMQDIAAGKEVRRKTLVETLTSPGFIALVVLSGILLGGYTTVNNAIELGRQQGYQPTQPIKFSHALHAGTNKIECQYCHDGARRSKHSVIPAANTCMNCHKAIKKGPQYGTAEITKIYASIGFNPNTDKYMENYEDMPRDDIKEVYTKWISETYESNNADAPEKEVLAETKSQWEGIVASLTNDTYDKKIAGPIEWPRIHNLPDHAYFNHAQHVSVGKLECQTCHGPVQEMEEVYQYSPLSMGWCINCHRQTPVQFEENPYYQSYEQYHNELEAGTRDKVTVEEIGGLECQKCHY
ncbi:MAG: c-type cytochrome [Saprospiraceae bacterium]